ncbi:MAG: sensor histidine kinase [Acidimicrobiales bacterium]|nr:sensor histidine kinase [Acidimicrobiales bacterium]
MTAATTKSASATDQPTPGEVLRSLRALKEGGSVEVNVLTASLAAILTLLRWGAIAIGLGWAATQASGGNVRVVATLAVAIFVATFRTVIPLRTDSPSRSALIFAMGDVVVLGLGLGISTGLNSPFVGCIMVSVAVVAFGWGLPFGALASILAFASAGVSTVYFTDDGFGFSPLAVLALVCAALFPGIYHINLTDAERTRRRLSDQRDRLVETNELLGALMDVARTLPSSLDLADVLRSTRSQLQEAFHPDRLVILTLDDTTLDEQLWSTQTQTQFDLPPTFPVDALPSPLSDAASKPDVLRINDLREISDRSGSGMYARLIVNGRDRGLVGVEREARAAYSPGDAVMLGGMADVLALTLSNARSFGHLRSLAAAEERSRIARDLHDRLGQWLTYISLELERIQAERDEPSPNLKSLHADTQGAIAELRDTLMELRATVGPGRPLGVLLGEVIDRIRKRSTLEIDLTIPEDRELVLGEVVENELLRIAQEALTNVEKHANASQVTVAWTIERGRGTLYIHDNGRGFDPARGIRGNAYGLVGMRERAASVGAILEVRSSPNEGTTITVLTSPTISGAHP